MSDKSAVLYAVLGFDERPILHCMMELEKRVGVRIERLVVYLARTGDKLGEERSRKALEALRYVAETRGTRIEHEELDPTQFTRNIILMASRIRGARERIVTSCLATGMRLLLLALYTAILAVSHESRREVLLCIEPEGQPEHVQVIDIRSVLAILGSLTERRDNDKVMAVLELLAESSYPLSLADIQKKLAERGVHIPKSTLHRILSNLARSGAIVKDEATKRYRLTQND